MEYSLTWNNNWDSSWGNTYTLSNSSFGSTVFGGDLFGPTPSIFTVNCIRCGKETRSFKKEGKVKCFWCHNTISELL
jgi:hypothetical protein